MSLDDLTLDGLKYKSEGEYKIAEFLTNSHIKFIYKASYSVKNHFHENLWEIWNPDFLLQDFQTLIEFFGVKDKPDYATETKQKLEIYEKNNERIIPLYSIDSKGEWKRKIVDYILNINNQEIDKRTNLKVDLEGIFNDSKDN